MARGETSADKHILDCKEACIQHPFIWEHITGKRLLRQELKLVLNVICFACVSAQHIWLSGGTASGSRQKVTGALPHLQCRQPQCLGQLSRLWCCTVAMLQFPCSCRLALCWYLGSLSLACPC